MPKTALELVKRWFAIEADLNAGHEDIEPGDPRTKKQDKTAIALERTPAENIEEAVGKLRVGMVLGGLADQTPSGIAICYEHPLVASAMADLDRLITRRAEMITAAHVILRDVAKRRQRLEAMTPEQRIDLFVSTADDGERRPVEAAMSVAELAEAYHRLAVAQAA